MWINCKIAGENAVSQDYKLRLESLLEWPFPIWNESIVPLQIGQPFEEKLEMVFLKESANNLPVLKNLAVLR